MLLAEALTPRSDQLKPQLPGYKVAPTSRQAPPIWQPGNDCRIVSAGPMRTWHGVARLRHRPDRCRMQARTPPPTGQQKPKHNILMEPRTVPARTVRFGPSPNVSARLHRVAVRLSGWVDSSCLCGKMPRCYEASLAQVFLLGKFEQQSWYSSFFYSSIR